MKKTYAILVAVIFLISVSAVFAAQLPAFALSVSEVRPPGRRPFDDCDRV